MIMAERQQTEQCEPMQDTHMANLRPYPGTPRWVKLSGIMVVIVILLVGIILLTGGHGPGRHMQPGGDSGKQTPHANVTEQGGQ
jgi:hypothetical protein